MATEPPLVRAAGFGKAGHGNEIPFTQATSMITESWNRCKSARVAVVNQW